MACVSILHIKTLVKPYRPTRAAIQARACVTLSFRLSICFNVRCKNKTTRDDEQTMTKQMSNMKPPTHETKTNCNRRTTLEQSIEKLLDGEGSGLNQCIRVKPPHQ